jgi:hypothetical protein
VSPEPYVRGQAFAFALFLIAAAILGPPEAALACAVIAGAASRALYSKYRRDVATSGVDVPHHRERLDLIVAGDARAAIAVGVVAAGMLLGFGVDSPDVGISPATTPLLAFGAAAVYVSSLVDWYVILPRVSGLLGVRPCRPDTGDHPAFPRTWRETTRWWYVHRIAAALVLSFTLSYAIAFTIDEYVSIRGGGTVVAGAVLGGLVAYRRAAYRAFIQGGHLTMIVGRTVRRRSTRRTTLFTLGRGSGALRMPGFRRRAFGPLGPREYVFDVALEGVQLVRADAREKAVPRDEEGNVVYERDPTKVPLKDVDATEPAEQPFTGCERQCSGINWYCIENPRCFAPK